MKGGEGLCRGGEETIKYQSIKSTHGKQFSPTILYSEKNVDILFDLVFEIKYSEEFVISKDYIIENFKLMAENVKIDNSEDVFYDIIDNTLCLGSKTTLTPFPVCGLYWGSINHIVKIKDIRNILSVEIKYKYLTLSRKNCYLWNFASHEHEIFYPDGVAYIYENFVYHGNRIRYLEINKFVDMIKWNENGIPSQGKRKNLYENSEIRVKIILCFVLQQFPQEIICSLVEMIGNYDWT